MALHVPERGEKRRLVALATQNAVEALAKERAEWLADEGKSDEALDGLADLRPALTLASEVGFVHPVAAGERISYGHRHQFSRDTVVATVPIGYADGLPRRATGHFSGRPASQLPDLDHGSAPALDHRHRRR